MEQLEQFRYVGRNPRHGKLMALHAVPASPEETYQNQISNFSKVFRDQVTTTLRSQGGLFLRSRSIYYDLPPQHGAFDRLMEIVENSNYDVASVTRSSVERGEFLCRVQVRIPTMPQFNERLFKEGIPPDHKGFVLVSFVTGVCREFTRLMKKNQLVEDALESLNKLRPGDLAELKAEEDSGTLDNLCAKVTGITAVEKDESFDPENAIPGVLKHMRAEQRYSIMGGVANLGTNRFYQTPEGFIYHVEIDGYVTAAVE
ncbi:hypothetical protein [Ralstonia phage RP12]|uniref:Uncharacterized protein n=1 Tax=Ralstonia phage RP12 TaxID=1923889 RepID=A0A1L7N0M4_9CAUD|nr:hypothetical protein FDH28_gp036 [Ralstonia phage RP12]BAW19010.1 hypothetical protein [Ralstonia phage RP12]